MVFKLNNVSISGCKVGIKTTGPVKIEANNVTFDNVETPWDTDEQATGTVQGGRITNDPKLRSGNRGASNRLGWRRPKGPPLPALCPSCNVVFASQNYVFAGRYWSLWDNEEQCPECGFEHAKVSEGIFNLIGDLAKVISAPDVTLLMLKQINEIVKEVSEKKLEPEAAALKITSVNSALGTLWHQACKVAGLITFFCAIISAYYSKIGADYARIGTDLGKEQVELGKEQVKLQKESIADKLLADMLSELKNSLTLTGTLKKQYEAQSITKQGNTKKTAPSKKWRDKQRAMKKEARRLLNPRSIKSTRKLTK
jgi:hypothetical protein